ncbi:MAG: MetS family NSS transporter small subunit [Ignavibacterium sp.]
MKIETIITAVIVLSVVWGGLIYFIRKALFYEKKKSVNG